jgi:hypothetical protein
MRNQLPQQFESLFWDIEFDKLNIAKDNFFIIERLAEKGNLDSIKWIFDNYHKTTIKSVIRKSPNISPSKKHLLTIVLK